MDVLGRGPTALIVLLAASVAGCYAPDLRDCAVTCSAATECADGQACRGGYCVADGSPTCAGADAAPLATTRLHLTISGHGHVDLGGVTVCDADAASNGDCTVTLPRLVAARVVAIANDNAMFQTWMGSTCPVGDVATCDFTPAAPTLSLAVKFR